jgi:hypothetical protein
MSSRKSISKRSGKLRKSFVKPKDTLPQESIREEDLRPPEVEFGNVVRRYKKLKKGEFTARKLYLMLETIFFLSDIYKKYKRVPQKLLDDIEPIMEDIIDSYLPELEEVIEAHIDQAFQLMYEYGNIFNAPVVDSFITNLPQYREGEIKIYNKLNKGEITKEEKDGLLEELVEDVYVSISPFRYINEFDLREAIEDQFPEIRPEEWFDLLDKLKDLKSRVSEKKKGKLPTKKYPTWQEYRYIAEKIRDAEHHGGEILFEMIKTKTDRLGEEEPDLSDFEYFFELLRDYPKTKLQIEEILDILEGKMTVQKPLEKFIKGSKKEKEGLKLFNIQRRKMLKQVGRI